MLERARDLDPVERALKEAKMGLSELEMKKTIGDISEDEYEAKAPGFKWDIDKHEDKISKGKEEIAFLEDLSRVMSTEEIARMKEMTEKCQSAMDGLEESGNISSETVARVKASLEGTLACLEDFECL
jgi:chromosome segregation ATPase